MWKYDGSQRPDFAIAPGPGQESVWDYPRPPTLVPCRQTVEIRCDSGLIARSTRAMRVLETASPPTVYIPPTDIDMAQLTPVPGESWCEWKGAASYWGLAHATSQATAIGWSYATPTPLFRAIQNWLCFYPGRIACYLDDERVRPQAGGFYGGWVTDAIVGPCKGEAGTGGW